MKKLEINLDLRSRFQDFNGKTMFPVDWQMCIFKLFQNILSVFFVLDLSFYHPFLAKSIVWLRKKCLFEAHILLLQKNDLI